MKNGSDEGPALVTVDATLCRGHARCMAVAPEAFEYDDDADQSRPRARDEIERIPLDRLRLAVKACPEGAIRLGRRDSAG